MALDFLYITNDVDVALVAEASGVHWIFVDLEILGKVDRQLGMKSVISNHTIDDVFKIRQRLTTSSLLVRINPINEKSEEEIRQVIEAGADMIMLPFYKTLDEVKDFIKYVDNKVKICLLCETKEAVEILRETAHIKGIDYIYIGLNDLHLSLGMKFMFEPLANGLLDCIVSELRRSNMKFGFGGIGKIGEGKIKAEHILAEHYQLGSELVILSRSFYNTEENLSYKELKELFVSEIHKLRDVEKEFEKKNAFFFFETREMIKQKVQELVGIN